MRTAVGLELVRRLRMVCNGFGWLRLWWLLRFRERRSWRLRNIGGKWLRVVVGLRDGLGFSWFRMVRGLWCIDFGWVVRVGIQLLQRGVSVLLVKPRRSGRYGSY